MEAQRLGLEAHASDLNPVAVLINKALIEIPPKFAGCPPVNPEAKKTLMGRDWHGAQGLADDIRYYGKWMRDEAEKRIGHLYPKVTLSRELGGSEAKVIAWLWTRTVTCPNPACEARMPLTTSFWLSRKKDRETWIKPVVDRTTIPPTISFIVETGKEGPPKSPKVGRGAQFQCLSCGGILPEQYIKDEGIAGRINSQLMATVAEGKNGRIYLSPTLQQELIAGQANPEWKPDQELAGDRQAIWCPLYGLTSIGDLFTPRQLLALTTFSDLVQEARDKVLFDEDTRDSSFDNCHVTAYADAIATYLAFAVDRSADFWSSIAMWSPQPKNELVMHTFIRQGIPMTWDYGEINPFVIRVVILRVIYLTL